MRVLVNHPAFGSLWLENAEIQDGYVVGDVWDKSGVGSGLLPDDYRGQYVPMNFPITCIRKIVKEDEQARDHGQETA